MIETKENIDLYKSRTFTGLSLWMCPSGPAEATSRRLIKETARECGTYGDFLPHVTLAAGIASENTIQKTRELATMIAPYEFEFDGLSGRDAFFQSLYIKLKTTPQVLLANAAARQVFEEKACDPEYMPHLSIVYGDLDNEEKSRIMQELEYKLKEETALNTFTVDNIQIWSTEGDVKDWYCVESIPLTGGKYSVEEKVPDLVESRDFFSIPKSKSMVIPEDSVPDLCESTDVSPESTLTKEEADDLQDLFFDTALLGQKLHLPCSPKLRSLSPVQSSCTRNLTFGDLLDEEFDRLLYKPTSTSSFDNIQ